jgi:formylglycine-generating enzyme required for sulfatase activity
MPPSAAVQTAEPIKAGTDPTYPPTTSSRLARPSPGCQYQDSAPDCPQSARFHGNPKRAYNGSKSNVGVSVLCVRSEANASAGHYTMTGGTVFDTKTKLTWQQTVPAARYAWADAKAYCQTVGLAGTGWRLPTRKELAGC